MAVGRPVVATRVGAMAEVIADSQTGMLVTPGDPADLERGIAAVLSAPDHAKTMGETGARIVRERFAAAGIAQATEHIYLDILGEKHGGHRP
jgi:glycosyltransferase involved in cell wall biosynthesis